MSTASSAQPAAASGSGRRYGHVKPVYGELTFLAGQTLPKLPDRPARVQIEQKRKLQAAEHLGEYNIWYGRYAGENNYEKAPKASTKCCLETDAGLTRADYTNPGACICLHFARGCCVYGKDCCYRHCAPNEADETQADAPHDCFGRDRHASFRDDMGGTGTWNRDCKTLYVGRMCSTPTEAQMTETIVRHFGEFGVLESARVLKAKGIAFVTYTMRCSAEFAKEAMAEQSLDNDEQINVRWAYDDPNPRAQAMRLRNDAQTVLAAMERRGDLESAEAYPDAPPPKRPRGDDEEEETAGPSEPMTREQFEAAQQAMAAAEEAKAAEEAEAEAARRREERIAEAGDNARKLDAILQGIGGEGDAPSEADPLKAFMKDLADGGGASEAPAPAEAELPPGVRQARLPAGWQEFTDPSSGFVYYVNGATGESSWAKPHA